MMDVLALLCKPGHSWGMIKRVLIAYALCFLIQAAGGYFTQMGIGSGWYGGLQKSPLTPPGYVFGLTWTVLYALMAVAAARVTHITGQWNNRPLRWWAIQLLGGVVWCIVFFGLREIALGFYVLVFTWLAVLIAFLGFYRVNRRAGWLMLPLLLWVSFASYLNFYILTHQ